MNNNKYTKKEIQLLENVVIYSYELGQLLFNAIKAEKKAKAELDNLVY